MTGTVDRTVADCVATWAEGKIGGQYQMRAAGPKAWDCSGLVVDGYRRIGGFVLPHNTVELRHKLKNVVSKRFLRRGDVVFYYDSQEPSHCAIFVGTTGPVGKRKFWVVQAGNERLGVQRIEMNAYTPAVAYGRVRRGMRPA